MDALYRWAGSIVSGVHLGSESIGRELLTLPRIFTGFVQPPLPKGPLLRKTKQIQNKLNMSLLIMSSSTLVFCCLWDGQRVLLDQIAKGPFLTLWVVNVISISIILAVRGGVQKTFLPLTPPHPHPSKIISNYWRSFLDVSSLTLL